MHSSRWILHSGLVALLALVAAAVPRPAQATGDFDIFVTQCDSMTVNGHAMQRVTFSIRNNSPTWSSFLILFPITNQAPGDTCHIVESTAPDGWGVYSSDPSGAVLWYNNLGQGFEPGATVHGFSMLLNRPTCCFDFWFGSVVLDTERSARVCFACPNPTDIPVPVLPRSWGSLKVQYR